MSLSNYWCSLDVLIAPPATDPVCEFPSTMGAHPRVGLLNPSLKLLLNRWGCSLFPFLGPFCAISQEKSLLIRSGWCWFFICFRNYRGPNEEVLSDSWFAQFRELKHRGQSIGICQYLLSLTGLLCQVCGGHLLLIMFWLSTRASKISQHRTN